MQIIAIIQARMSSSRLPGKMLMPINNKPVIQYVVERIKKCKNIDKIIVATSTDPTDDNLYDFCMNLDFICYRGSLLNVSGRFFDVLLNNPCNAFVRVCGDRPLCDHNYIESAIELFLKGNYDIVTNSFPPSFPKGQTVEIVNTSIFCEAYHNMDRVEDFEHVTNHFYCNQLKYDIFNFSYNRNMSNISLALDTFEDFKIISQIFSLMERDHCSYSLDEIIKIYHSIIKET